MIKKLFLVMKEIYVKILIRFAIILGVILLQTEFSHSQYIANLSDEQCIELSLDMIRRGIQQENSSKVMDVIGANIIIKGSKEQAKSLFEQSLNQIFNNSSSRVSSLGKETLSKTKSYFNDSNLWDFDILAPEITVIGDSAFVECELLLGVAFSGDINSRGAKIKESLVFWSPFEGQSDKTESNNPLRWKLVGCNNIIDFLGSYGADSLQVSETRKLKY